MQQALCDAHHALSLNTIPYFVAQSITAGYAGYPHCPGQVPVNFAVAIDSED